MENALRTAAYHAEIVGRRSLLHVENATWLGDATRCVLEIGCGHGHFLTDYAQAHPEKLCVGLDIISDRIDRANRKKNRARVANLHFIHAGADDFLATLPPVVRFTEVFVLFPDPWPKRRHHKNRLMQAEFLTTWAQRAEQGTRVYFRTDDAPYFAAATHEIAIHTDWEITAEAWAFEYETVFQQRAAGYQSCVARRKTS